MKRASLAQLFSILAIVAVVVTMAPPALSSFEHGQRGGIGAPLAEAMLAADGASAEEAATPLAGAEPGRGEARGAPADEEPPDEIDAGGDDVGGYLATVLGAAPDLWTGNSSFVYPLDLPAGRAASRRR